MHFLPVIKTFYMEDSKNQKNNPQNTGRTEQGQKEVSNNMGYENTESKKRSSQDGLSAMEDGRNKEWADRARVNLENQHNDEEVFTNVERDFEPSDDNRTDAKEKDNPGNRDESREKGSGE